MKKCEAVSIGFLEGTHPCFGSMVTRRDVNKRVYVDNRYSIPIYLIFYTQTVAPGLIYALLPLG